MKALILLVIAFSLSHAVTGADFGMTEQDFNFSMSLSAIISAGFLGIVFWKVMP